MNELLSGLLSLLTVATPIFGTAPSVLKVSQGGTGASSFTIGECLKGNGTGPITTGSCGTGTADGTFSTTSASFWIDQYSKGYFFSTTSADYWETQQPARGGSGSGWATTSASWHLSQNQGLAFSTTSADWWGGQKGYLTSYTETDPNSVLKSQYYSTTTHPLISSLPSLVITESQISDLGPYDAVTTAGDGLTRTVNDFDCDIASGSVFGCLSTSDWTTFNNKESALTFSLPLIRTGNTIAWSGLATTTQPSSSNLLVSNGGAGVYGVATTSASCSGTVSCSTFTIIGSSPITLTGSGGGGGWPFTTTASYNGQVTQSTSTLLWLRGSILSLAASSSHITYSSSTAITAANLDLTNSLTFNGVTGTTWAAFCETITGAAGLCDGDDATGGGSGGGTPSKWATSTVDSNAIFTAGATKVGIGSSTPWGLLSLDGTLPISQPFFQVGSILSVAASTTGPNFSSSTPLGSGYGVFNFGLSSSTQTMAGNIDNVWFNGRVNYEDPWLYNEFLDYAQNFTADQTVASRGIFVDVDGGCTVSNSTAEFPGITGAMSLATGAAVGNGCHIDLGSTNQFRASSTPAVEVRLQPNTTVAGYSIFVGFGRLATGAASGTVTTVGNYFLYDPNINANWQAVTRTSLTSGATTTTSFPPVANMPQTLRVEYSPSSARFFINGVHVATHWGGISPMQMEPEIFVNTHTASAKTVLIDYLKVWANR